MAARSRKRGRRKADRASRVLRALGMFAVALGVVTVVLFILKFSEGTKAADNANKLLVDFQAKPTVTPGMEAETPAPSASPTPTLPAIAEMSDEQANQHRVDDGLEVDETGDYVQPDEAEHEDAELQALIEKIVAAEGEDGVIGLLEIPEIDVELPIIGKWSYSLLKISICRYQGPLPNHKGHLVLIGHNYKSGAHFGNLKKLKVGAEIFITDTVTNERLRYEVYEIKTIPPNGFSEIKVFKGEAGLTLLTCENSGNDRKILRCVQKDVSQG